MSRRVWIIYILLAVLALGGCAAGRGTPTPTIVPLNRPGKGLSQPEQAATATATATPTEAPPTATPIPFPSPTPTRTPMSFALASSTPAPVSEATAAGATPTPAPAAIRAEVISFALNVRQGPGLDYPVIATAQAGDQFEVVGQIASGNWLQVVVAGDNLGWISGKSNYTRLLGPVAEVPVVPTPAPPAAGPRAPAAPQGSGSQRSSSDSQLVFTTTSGGELYLVNADGSHLRRLAGGVIDPVLSPDGTKVAFTRWDGAEVGTLYTLDLASGQERAVAGDILQAKSPTWSPDGQQIVVSFQHGGLRNPEEKCKEYDMDDGIRIPNDVAEITKFRVSGDGINVCYVRQEDLQWGLRQVNVETGHFEDLPVDLYSYNPAWDPQNSWRVVYAGDKGLMQFDVNTGEQWPLTTDLRDTGPVFSPDGQRLALTYKQHDHWEGYTLDLETGARHRLTKPPILADPQYNSASPAWSPDGARIAFLTDRTGQWEIWVMNADGSDPQPLLPSEVQAELNLQYHGVNEHMLNWAG